MSKKMKQYDLPGLPTTQALEDELKRVKNKERNRTGLRNAVYILIVVAAVAVLLAGRFFPVMRIYGDSMNPTLQNGDVIAAVKSSDFASGDLIAFYSNNKILVKRVIGVAGDRIGIDANGVVTVNGTVLDEPYISGSALGTTDMEFPYQVPEGRYFVMGDHREISIDSRHSKVGCVSQEQIVGKVLFRFWPFDRIGGIR